MPRFATARPTRFALAITVLAASPDALAQDSIWQGGDGSWADPTRWIGGVAPTDGASVYIDADNPLPSVVTFAPAPGGVPISLVRPGYVSIDAGDVLRWQSFQTRLEMNGELRNAGRIDLYTGSGTSAGLEVGPGLLRLTGGGEITSAGFYARIRSAGAPCVLHNVDNTIRGSGIIGDAMMTLVNEGVIRAEGGSRLTIETRYTAGDYELVNTGRIEAINSPLDIASMVDNSAGHISMQSSGSSIRTLDLEPGNGRGSGAILGGLIESLGSIRLAGGSLRGGESGLTVRGNWIVQTQSYVTTLDGPIVLDGNFDPMNFELNSGTVELRGGVFNVQQQIRHASTASAAIVNHVDSTITGRGTIGAFFAINPGSFAFTNYGTVRPAPGVPLGIVVRDAPLENFGLIEAQPGAWVSLGGPANEASIVRNFGTMRGEIQIGSGATFEQRDGLAEYYSHYGTYQTRVLGGELRIRGTIGPIYNDGLVRIGNGPGKLTIASAFYPGVERYRQTKRGTLEFEIAGPGGPGVGYDQLVVEHAGDAPSMFAVEGTIEIKAINGYSPTSGPYEFIILNRWPPSNSTPTFSVTGFPAHLEYLIVRAFPDGYALWVFHDGDLNCDGAVTVADIAPFILALTNRTQYDLSFRPCPANNADINDDDFIGMSDIGPFVELLLNQ